MYTRITGSPIRNRLFICNCLTLDISQNWFRESGTSFIFMKIIFDYNRTIFDPETDNLYLGVLELLQKLSVKYELFLISRNEPTRKRKLKEFHIKNYFQKILFVDEKTEKIFKKIAGDTRKIVVIGDNISDEIKIGNQLGFLTIRLKKGKFSTETPKNEKEIAKFEVGNIGELENIILSYEKQN